MSNNNYTNLLPSNSSLKQVALDKTISARIQNLKQADFNLLATTCKEEFLPHLAFLFSLDITNLKQQEQRDLIKNAYEIYRYAGTAYSVKLALQSIFSTAEIKTWLEDESLEPYHFTSNLTLSSDVSKKYDSKKFAKVKELLEISKSKRDVFDGFSLKFANAKADIKVQVASVLNLKLSNTLNLNSSAKIKIIGGVVWTI